VRYSRSKDILKSLASFALVELILFGLLYYLLPMPLKPAYVEDHMIATARESLSYDILTERVGQIVGYIEGVAWAVFAVTQAIALIWLVYAWSVRVYKPGMARGHLPIHIIVFALGVPLIGALVALDGYVWCWWIDTGLRELLTADLRFYLAGGMIAYCILCFLLATAIAVPPVMRRAALGGTALGRVTDTLRVWEI
jgi:hypothetical protein